MDTRYSSRYCVTVFPVIFRKRRQQTSRDRCTFLPLLRCIPDDRSAVLLPARPSRRLPHLDSEYAERTRTVCRMHGRACDASCCYRLAVTLLRLHCRLHRKPACLVRCNCTADSSLLSDDDEACKNSVIKIGPPDIDMPGNAKPGILSLLF